MLRCLWELEASYFRLIRPDISAVCMNNSNVKSMRVSAFYQSINFWKTLLTNKNDCNTFSPEELPLKAKRRSLIYEPLGDIKFG